MRLQLSRPKMCLGEGMLQLQSLSAIETCTASQAVSEMSSACFWQALQMGWTHRGEARDAAKALDILKEAAVACAVHS